MSYLYEKEKRVKITREEYYELIKNGAVRKENVIAIPQRIQNIYSGYRFYACKNYMEKLHGKINEKEDICIKIDQNTYENFLNKTEDLMRLLDFEKFENFRKSLEKTGKDIDKLTKKYGV